MALRSFQLLKLLKYSRANYNNVRFLTAAGNVSSTISKKEYKTENKLIYNEDPDNFGTLSRQVNNPVDLEDEQDIKEDNYITFKPLYTQKLTTRQYADLIKEYLKYKRLKEAIDVLEVRMLVEDKVQPENYIYNLLIGACADFGYTKKAFKLYNKMKQRDLKVTGDTYTCLFNACANSPLPLEGLKQAKHLRELMQEKGVEPNLTNYNSMIKAFGRCGDLSTAFQIVDEMKVKKIPIRVHTFNFLLQACITDKSTGLRHALIVWRKMLRMREKPNIYSFNLMLKCVKDCNVGSKADIRELMLLIQKDVNTTSTSNVKLLDKEVPVLHTEDSTSSTCQSTDNKLTTNNPSIPVENRTNFSTPSIPIGTMPNLLSKCPQMHQILDVIEVSTPQQKFAIVGGANDFLREMKSYSVKPDIKTFTQILPLIEDGVESENKLLELMKAENVRADIDFYNLLIKKRSMRSDYKAALAVKDLIRVENKLRKKKYPFKKKLQIKSNIMTYGVLAMTCKTKEEAENFLQEMNEDNLKVNIEILGTLLHKGTVCSDFGYILYIMNTVVKENLKVNDVFLKHLINFNDKCEDLMKQDENGKRKCSEIFVKTHTIYAKYYNTWLEKVNVEQLVVKEHPWKQFKQNLPVPFQRDIVIKEPKRFYRRSKSFVKPYKA